ncbi:ribonuclease H-like domain-containing protein [Chlorogloeopsis sp. ULAP01]|uniref:ribonuclease H-like domain-containing protein n=1 Tax=Chlorogloeopsis sp. ULAP01 TaxID=3056483 RepID=UPI0025AA79FE|nr:ribonuclease H-like domain-containing protein [Chlorogloeopsis sp. ULAP01]MDM9382825.1 ribonuclease H-like domain-containing protein [Chlorogloeopsis sp. ULAP01]
MELQNFQVYDRDLSEATLSQYLEASAIAVDTETMGLIPQRDRLCLVQLCNYEGQVTAIRISKGQNEAPNLKKLLEAANVIKIFHFARFDLAALRYHLGIQVNPVFCSKIASKLARTYTQRHGLKDVVMELEQVELDKSAQSSDWGNAANLTKTQLSYAANDVRYLLKVREKLIEMLKREERWELAQECFRCLPTIVSLDLLQFKDLFEH